MAHSFQGPPNPNTPTPREIPSSFDYPGNHAVGIKYSHPVTQNECGGVGDFDAGELVIILRSSGTYEYGRVHEINSGGQGNFKVRVGSECDCGDTALVKIVTATTMQKNKRVLCKIPLETYPEDNVGTLTGEAYVSKWNMCAPPA